MSLTSGRLAAVVLLVAMVPGAWLIPDKECFGLRSGLSIFGSPREHYQRIRAAYEGCTHVIGDLTVSWLNDPNIDYDLSFLRHIRYVRDYVAIVGNDALKEVYLPSLELVRGLKGFDLERDLGLLVALNTQMVHLSMPKLREISEGGVTIMKNPQLCGPLHVDWLSLMPHPGVVHISDVSSSCPGCHSDCPDPRKCWGPFPRDCQKADFSALRCPAQCPHRCFQGPGDVTSCCHQECAFGCSGPHNTDCEACRSYSLQGACVPHCPPDDTFHHILTCKPF